MTKKTCPALSGCPFWGQNEATRQLIEPTMQELERDSILSAPSEISAHALDDDLPTLSTPATTSLLL